MRVFLAGATGVIGTRLLGRLEEEGHAITTMTRSPDAAIEFRKRGFESVVCDALDADDLRRAVRDAEPEVVIHQLTSIPKAINPKRYSDEFAANDRLRVEGTANLVRAAVEAGAKRIVAQGVAFSYAPVGSTVKTEADPLYLDAPPPFGRGVQAIASLERSVLEAGGIEGVVLRYGFFYGPGTAYASDGSVAATVLRRRFPIVGDGTGCFSFVHIDDAAQATIWALTRGNPGAYNVVDIEPAAVRTWLPMYAKALRAPKPFRVPAWLGKAIGGPYTVYLMTQMRGASCDKAVHELGWEPRFPSWRVGFFEALG